MGRNPQWPPLARVLRRVDSPMMQLGGDPAIVPVHGCHQRLQPGQEAILGQAYRTGNGRAVGPADRGHTRYDQCRAAPRLAFMIGNQALSTGSVILPEIHTHGGDDHAVLQCHAADAAGRAQQGKVVSL